MSEPTALEQREGKHADKLSSWRKLYGRAVELATYARDKPPEQFGRVRADIAATRRELLGFDSPLFGRPLTNGATEDQAAAARLTVDALTRSAIATHLDLADRTLDGRENFRLLRRTLRAAWITLAVAAATLVASLVMWRIDHREHSAETQAHAVAHSAEVRCEQATTGGAILPSCPGFRGGKFDPYQYAADTARR